VDLFCENVFIANILMSFWLCIIIDIAVDDVGLSERITVTRHFKDKIVRPILKVCLLFIKCVFDFLMNSYSNFVYFFGGYLLFLFNINVFVCVAA